jgi:hypothetical protein
MSLSCQETVLLADIFSTLALALEDVPDCLYQDAYVAAELHLSLGILRQQLVTLATLDTALANGFSDVVEQLAQIVHVLQGSRPRKPQVKSRSTPRARQPRQRSEA